MNNFDLYKDEYDKLLKCSIRLNILKDFLKIKKESGHCLLSIEDIETIIGECEDKRNDE